METSGTESRISAVQFVMVIKLRFGSLLLEIAVRNSAHRSAEADRFGLTFCE